MTTEEQFLELVQENQQKLCVVCRYYAALCSAVCEEDLLQEIVLNLWKSYPRYVKRPACQPSTWLYACQPSTWLYRVALNVAISQVRKSGTRKFQSISEVEERITDNSVEENLSARIYELISQLNQEDQALIFLYLDEKSHTEMAEILGISVTNVGTKIQRIKQKLKKLNNE